MKNNEPMNLEWLQELMGKLPETDERRKNLIEIAGYPHWENVNSNFLAFYFDENEEHGFSRLFFRSLIDLIEEKHHATFKRGLFDYENPYTVEREFSVSTGHKIDILIYEDPLKGEETVETNEETGEDENTKDSQWAIIIENKIHADLYNKLGKYWKGIKSPSKIGVVLSIEDLSNDDRLSIENDLRYINITHKELVDKVCQNLPQEYMQASDKHLLYLREYIDKINAFFSDNVKSSAMNEKLDLFHENASKILDLNTEQKKLLEWIGTRVFSTMESFGFPPVSTSISKTKLFEPNIEAPILNELNSDFLNKFRFVVDISRLRYKKDFCAIFELFDAENTQYGEKLRDQLNKKIVFTKNIEKGTKGAVGATYCHIYSIKFKFDENFTEKSFEDQLKDNLNDFFKDDYHYIKVAVNELEKIVKEVS